LHTGYDNDGNLVNVMYVYRERSLTACLVRTNYNLHYSRSHYTLAQWKERAQLRVHPLPIVVWLHAFVECLVLCFGFTRSSQSLFSSFYQILFYSRTNLIFFLFLLSFASFSSLDQKRPNWTLDQIPAEEEDEEDEVGVGVDWEDGMGKFEHRPSLAQATILVCFVQI
jgi:hypothetical protein